MLGFFDFLLEKDIFLTLFNLSVSASFLVLAVIVLRFLLKKAPRWSICLLWGLVGLRLIFPFSIESVFSLIPSAETVSPEIVYEAEPTIDSGIEIVDNIVNPILIQTFAPSLETVTSVNPMQIFFAVMTVIWFLGLVAMVVYMLGGYIFLRFRLRTAVKMTDNIFQSEKVSSPFIFGMFRPRIYLPFSMDEADMQSVIAHERAHLKRLDHLVKPLTYLILAVYWFNPLLWVAYILFCRDIELACDEKVVREMDTDAKKAYSMALLKCSMNKQNRLTCPLAFGEVGVKERVKNVMHYKKPAFWIILLAVVAIIVTAVCFLTVPRSDDDKDAVEVYRVASVAGYADYSFITETDHPISSEYKYMIENVNHKFFKQKTPAFDDDWISVGSLVEEKMNKKEMQALFPRKFDFTEDGFFSVSFQELVKENETVYRIENNTEWLSYLFYQENGNVYWGCGYKEDGLIRGLWRLVYAKSSPNANLMIPNEDVTECVGFYQAVEDIGSHMAFSWYVGASETPYYYIAENGWLFEQKRGTSDWVLLGGLQKAERSEAQKQLVKLFEIPFMFEDDSGTGGDSKLRNTILAGISGMWTLTREENDTEWTYYFIQVNNGTMYFGKGHDGILRWLYRMERVAEYETYTKPQTYVVSATSYQDGLNIKATKITFDDQSVRLTVAFTNTSDKTSYYLRDSSLFAFAEQGYYVPVSEYEDTCAPIYLGKGQTVYRDFIFERSYMENNSYMLNLFLKINNMDIDGVCGYIVFQYGDDESPLVSDVSAKVLHSDIEVSVTNVAFDDRYIKINASFINRNSEKEYNLTYTTLDQYIEGDYQTIVLYYADEVPGPYLPHDITVPYKFTFERKDLENGKYRVSIFLDNDSYMDNSPQAHIFFELENFE